MRNKLLAIVVISVLLPGLAAAQAKSPSCDRACLEKFVDQYLDAMVAHNPGKLFTADVRFTENGQKLPLGEGLWSSIVGKGTYKFYVPDVETQQIGFIGTAYEESREKNSRGDAVAIALRLKIVNSQISEAEQLVVRGSAGLKMPSAGASLEKRGKPHPVFAEVIPAAQRPSREEMIKTANYYFAGIQRNDGKGYYPFTDDCDRFENGMQATNVPLKPGEKRPDPKTSDSYSSNWSCKEQFESGLIHFVSRVRDRRFVAVDRERGVVYSFTFFDHGAGKTRTFQTPDGRTVTSGPTTPWTWEIAELFKVEKGKIRKIEAVLLQCPYGMNSGWSTYEQGMSDQPQIIK
jgi:hypothetical protein